MHPPHKKCRPQEKRLQIKLSDIHPGLLQLELKENRQIIILKLNRLLSRDKNF
jgi:hypothetical protein